ncbi:MAG TPA: Asp-tRNA(Asn)/Glu-tRNA(Gln) amidotransferase subunit GatC [Gemmatimonadaceae bacterium]|nr:Asp-tRNA(Asn)/Glu-tRNA(Gln) amidotransferase subunit GatC [Gemmatimonadaceae bacterium]
MAVTETDIRKIADLARLSLADEEVPAMTAQLNSILAHMDVLTRVDTASVAEAGADAITSAIAVARDVKSGGAPLRGDAVAPFPMDATAPMLAPDSEDGFILVPRLSTHEDM